MARASRAGENRDKEWDRIAAIFDAELAKLGEPTVKTWAGSLTY